jgi:hypothetical protein
MLFSAYGHIFITKVFDEWQLRVVLYLGYPNVNKRQNSCSQTFMGDRKMRKKT